MSGRSILPVVVYSPNENREEQKDYAIRHLMDTRSLGMRWAGDSCEGHMSVQLHKLEN